MTAHRLPRRGALLSALALAGCAAPLPELTAPVSSPEAQALLARSAAAHGLPAFRVLSDVSVSYDGQWAPIINSLQPALVNRGFRGRSEERLLPREGLVAQAHTGPAGRKQVLRRPGGITVRFNGDEAQDADQRAAAAIVTDGYTLFLLGPLVLTGGWGAPRTLVLEAAGQETIIVDGRTHTCDVLRARITPGLGLAPSDRLALFLDREDGLMRRVRFTLDGLRSTRGAVAEVDAWGHVTHRGVRWPTRFHERLLRPLPLPVHDWRLTGLDLDRGLRVEDLEGPALSGRAAAPASPLVA